MYTSNAMVSSLKGCGIAYIENLLYKNLPQFVKYEVYLLVN